MNCECGKPEWVRTPEPKCRECYLKSVGHQNWLDLDKGNYIISDGRKTERINNENLQDRNKRDANNNRHLL